MTEQDMKYAKARKDMIEALNSFNELTAQQQCDLANELLKSAVALKMSQMMNPFR